MISRIVLLLALSVANTQEAQPLAHAFPKCPVVENDSQLAEAAAFNKSSWQGPIGVQGVERSNMKTNADGAPIPFGKFNDQWLEFKRSMKPGDRIYSAAHTEGVYLQVYMLVRGGCVARFGTMTVLS
ncbi:hypothetical protein [Dyella japonica]|uniref:Uncharacterized protein n=1 Tax=Dyella japonica A8 TaxID=1217721 RepID=A0A075JX02_9GAMM|nr:hypothetical protein [Dyella japonica]AIF46017.1 hypothetical protein HY57_01410 [Dyella japonica A8]